MCVADLLVLNLTEIRRRSLKVWQALPPDKLEWRPTPDAFSAIGLIRHVLEDDLNYALIIENRGRLPETTDHFADRPVATVADDLEFAAPFRARLLATVRSFSDAD